MKFHEFNTLYDYLKSAGSKDSLNQFENGFLKRPEVITKLNDPSYQSTSMNDQYIQCTWMRSRRPYYSVYPIVTKSIQSISLDIDSELINVPSSVPGGVLLIRFPIGNEFVASDKGLLVRSILISNVIDNFSKRHLHFTACFCLNPGEIAKKNEATKLVDSFEKQKGVTVEEALRHREYSSVSEENFQTYQSIARIAAAVCLLADDPSIIKPDVLNDDRQRFDETGDLKYVERAHKRGKVGWLVGADWETCPHYRRPHLALRWTGEGHAIPRIVPVKGAVVHRAKLSDVPTGYLDDDKTKSE